VKAGYFGTGPNLKGKELEIPGIEESILQVMEDGHRATFNCLRTYTLPPIGST